ncbi:EAL domain-containing protein [Anaerotignum sp.]|uniref:EAL domain-containing protein n=1 Tax=Anaerotignum sp. TaxID=2039241 RepID=UPI0028ABFA90|nr:EAL domain-containing protein [Anaerotignum sp.]
MRNNKESEQTILHSCADEKSMAFLKHIYHSVPCGIFTYSDAEIPKILTYNYACSRIYGYEDGRLPFVGAECHIAVLDGDKEYFLEKFQYCRKTNTPVHYLLPVQKKDGTIIQKDCVLELIESKDGTRNFLEIFVDATERVVTEHALDNTSISIWEYDFKTYSILQGVRSMEIHGLDRVIQNVPESLIANGSIHPDDASAYRNMFTSLHNGAQRTEGIFRILSIDNTYYWYEHIQYTSMFDSGGKPYRAIGISEDVTNIVEFERRNAELAKEAETDAMTGLLNHEATFRFIRDALLKENEFTHALFMIDVDDFKRINDTYGHQTGDEIIRQFAQRIHGCFRDVDIIGRIGGDEVIVLMRKVPNVEAVTQKAELLLRNLYYSHITPSGIAELTASVGISLYHTDGISLESLYAAADKALYASKRRGKGCYSFSAKAYTEDTGKYALMKGDDCITVPVADVDYERLFEKAARRLVERKFDFISLVEVQTQYFKLVHSITPDTTFCPTTGTETFDEQMNIAGSRIHSVRGSEHFRKEISFQHISQILKNKDVFFHYDTIATENGLNRYKKWSAFYLDNTQQYIVFAQRDISDTYEVKIDPLTGVYNYRTFCRRVRKRLNDNSNTSYLILRYDIDRFKAFNNLLGMKAGDDLLRNMGRNLQDSLPDDCIFGHVDADHFVALLPVETVDLNQWFNCLQSWLDKYPSSFQLKASAGIYPIVDPSLDVSIMCDRAKLALRQIKARFVDKIGVYSEQLLEQLIQEQTLLNDVGRAFEEEQFVLYFQPQINYESSSLIGAEALVRWQHPELGLVSPNVFIPIFEKNGLIRKLDKYVWEKSCAYIKRWEQSLDKLLPISVSVNVSRIDICDGTLCDYLVDLTKGYSISPSMLHLEITESAYMDAPDRLVDMVRQLQNAGFAVEMDDFGSGYSSLKTLEDVPVDMLKLDIKFISDLQDSPRGDRILSSVIRMARWLNLPVIAEGVETQLQAEYLKSFGCIYMQGYYFGKPQPAEEFEALLSEKTICNAVELKQINDDSLATFWDASTQKMLLFNSLIGGAGVFEYHNGVLESIRLNNDYFQLLGITREIYKSYEKDILCTLDEDSQKTIIESIERALQTGSTQKGVVSLKRRSPLVKVSKLRFRGRLLTKSGDDYLLYVTVEDEIEQKTEEEK